jgi:hypothetical protein
MSLKKLRPQSNPILRILAVAIVVWVGLKKPTASMGAFGFQQKTKENHLVSTRN